MKRGKLIVLYLIFSCFTLMPLALGEQSLSTRSGIVIDMGIKVLANNFDGNTTDFLHKTDEELASIHGLELENTLFGKIVFYPIINLTEVVENQTVDLDSHVTISSNLIDINITHLSNLYKSAKLFLYGLDFADPVVLRNGNLCPTEVCAIERYSAGVLIFNTTGFSNYSVMQRPSSEEGPLPSNAGPSGSGGASGRESILNFSVNPEIFDMKIKTGSRNTEYLYIKNTGSESLLFTLEIFGIGKWAILDKTVFSLAPNQTEVVKVYFFTRENEEIDIHTGKIIVHTVSMDKDVNIILQTWESQALFDINSTLKENIILRSGKLDTSIELSNIGDEKKLDVLLEYFINDFSGNKIKLGEETIGVEKRLKINREFTIPEKLSTGDYLFYVKLSYNNLSATSSNLFTLTDQPVTKVRLNSSLYFAIFFWVIILILLIYFLVMALRKKRIAFRKC